MERRLARRRRVATALALAALLTCAPALASAQEPRMRLNARRGIQGITRAFSPNPLTIVVESDSFFSGWIEVIAPNATQSNVRYRQALELTAGSRKTVTMFTPRASVNSVRAVESDGDIRARASIPGDDVLRRGEPLIGVLSQAPPRTASVEVPILGEPARVVPVPVDVLSLGWAGLDLLSHLVVDGAVLRTLSPTQRASITAYATGGGEVILATGDRAEAATLDASLGSGSARAVGSGRISVVSAPLSHDGWGSDGRYWREALRPVDITRWTRSNARAATLGQAIRETGGFRRAALGWLLFFVLAYVALVGPVNFMVLARLRRRELAWLTIPAISLVFALGAYVAGVGLRNAPQMQGVALAVFSDGAQHTELGLGVVGRRDGNASVELSGGWSAESSSAVSGRQDGQRIDFGRNSLTARFELTSGEIGTLVANRTSPTQQVSAGSVTVEANRYVGNVTNPLAVALRSPRLFVGPSAAELGGELSPGESKRVAVDVFDTDGRSLVGSEFDGPIFSGSFDDQPQPEPPSLFRRAGLVGGLARTGVAYLTGWVPIETFREQIGTPNAKGNVLVLLPVRLEDPRSRVPAQAVRADIVATDGEFNVFDDPFGGGGGNAINNGRRTIVRFRLPAEAAPSRLRLRGDGPNPFGVNLRFQKRVLAEEPGDGQEIDPEGNVAVRAFPDGGGLAAEVYEPRLARWVEVRPRADGSLVFSGPRVISPDGEVYVRVLNDFGQILSPSMFTLEGVST